MNNRVFADIDQAYQKAEIRDLFSYVKSACTPEEFARADELFNSLDEAEDDGSSYRSIVRLYDFLADKDLAEAARLDSFDFTRAVIPKVLEKIKDYRHVLDVGCFDGLHTLLYAASMPETGFVGVDLSERSLARARENARKYNIENVEFVNADVLGLPFHESFDCVVATNVLHETGYWAPSMLGGRVQVRKCSQYAEKLAEIGSATLPKAMLVLTLMPESVAPMSQIINYDIKESVFEKVDERHIEFSTPYGTETCLFVVAKKAK